MARTWANNKKNDRKTLQRKEKIFKALQMRLDGKDYREIAKKLGVTPSTANRYVTDAIKEYNKKITEQVEILRELELKRLDKALETVMRALKSGKYHAVDQLIALQKQKERFIDIGTREEKQDYTFIINYQGIQENEF